MTDHIPGAKSKFPGGEAKLASLRIYWSPDPGMFLGKRMSKAQ